MEYYTIGQFSKLAGKSIQTLRLWDNEGNLKPHHIQKVDTAIILSNKLIKRVNKAKKMIKELLENDTGEES